MQPIDIQPDSPTSPWSIVETFLSSEHVDRTVNFINNYASDDDDELMMNELMNYDERSSHTSSMKC